MKYYQCHNRKRIMHLGVFFWPLVNSGCSSGNQVSFLLGMWSLYEIWRIGVRLVCFQWCHWLLQWWILRKPSRWDLRWLSRLSRTVVSESTPRMESFLPAQLPWETHLLSKCKTCLTVSEEADLAAPGSVRESLCDPKEELLHKTFGCCCKGGC